MDPPSALNVTYEMQLRELFPLDLSISRPLMLIETRMSDLDFPNVTPYPVQKGERLAA